MQTALQTERLSLRQVQQHDYPFYLSLNQIPQVMHFIEQGRSEQKIAELFAKSLPPWHQQAEQTLQWLIAERETGALVGFFGARLQNPPQGPAEIGYRLHPAMQGHGYAQEAGRAVLRFLFETCGVHKAEAVVTGGNQVSSRLLERLGFRLEGIQRQHYWMGGAWHDDWHYGLLADDPQPG